MRTARWGYISLFSVGALLLIRLLIDAARAAGATPPVIRLAAPTGKAAARMMDSVRQGLASLADADDLHAHLPEKASTLHRLLGIGFGTVLPRYDRERPLAADVVIVDEASMIDVPLGASLLSALPDAARLVIVGDADQLPSVGPGALLRDVIDSGVVTVVRLNEIFRQAGESRIVQNAHRILTGDMPESADPESPKADFFVV